MPRFFTRARLASIGLLAFAGSASANLVVNGDFESPEIPSSSPELYAVGESLDGWSVFGPGRADVAVLNGPFTQLGLTFTHQSGVQSLDLTGLSNTTAGVSQSIATVPGVAYDLSFYVGNVQSSGIWGTSSTVRVLLNGASFATASYAGGPTDALGWERFSYQFVATASSTALAFVNLDGPTDNVNQIDAVSVTVVPEPATAALLLCGMAAVMALRGRKARSSALDLRSP